jgi:hypothetical protein
MPDLYASAIAYRVEISGWDDKQEFFVEKADLEWAEDSGKQVLLVHPVEPHALLFIRLLDPTSSDRACPVPYQAELVQREAQGRWRVTLAPATRRSRME